MCVMERKGRFQIRKAAGLYWALDMEQPGDAYVKPIPLNECGAFLFARYLDGAAPKQLADALSDTYGISAGQAQEDADAFLKQMQAFFGEEKER